MPRWGPEWDRSRAGAGPERKFRLPFRPFDFSKGGVNPIDKPKTPGLRPFLGDAAKFRENGEREGCWKKRSAAMGAAGGTGCARGGVFRVRDGRGVLVLGGCEGVASLGVADR